MILILLNILFDKLLNILVPQLVYKWFNSTSIMFYLNAFILFYANYNFFLC